MCRYVLYLLHKLSWVSEVSISSTDKLITSSASLITWNYRNLCLCLWCAQSLNYQQVCIITCMNKGVEEKLYIHAGAGSPPVIARPTLAVITKQILGPQTLNIVQPMEKTIWVRFPYQSEIYMYASTCTLCFILVFSKHVSFIQYEVHMSNSLLKWWMGCFCEPSTCINMAWVSCHCYMYMCVVEPGLGPSLSAVVTNTSLVLTGGFILMIFCSRLPSVGSNLQALEQTHMHSQSLEHRIFTKGFGIAIGCGV